MIAFLLINAHLKPSKVLIIGGSDGSVARGCPKHLLVQRLIQCEIDELVIKLPKKYFPSMATSYVNPKLELVIGDGYKYLADLPDESMGVIITDSSDPEGPAFRLFQQPYHEVLEKKLTQTRIICCQAESIWFDLNFISNLLILNRKILEKVAYASTMTCTYPSGQIGFLICGKDANVYLTELVHQLDQEKLDL